MPTITKLGAAAHRKHAKVRAARDLPGVPKGTPGKVRVVNGIAWLRYWVRFDNGAWLGQLDHADLVPAADWDDYLRREEQAASSPGANGDAAAAGEAAGDSPAAAATGGTVVNGVSVPAHLLDRSKKARERLGA